MSKYHTDESVRIKIDELLIQYRSIESNMGKDSSESDRKQAKLRQRAIIDKIKPLDEEHWNVLTAGENQQRGNIFVEWFNKYSHLLKVF